MILQVDADYREGDGPFEVRDDELFPWLEAQGYRSQGLDDDEWDIPTEDVVRVEDKIRELNATHNVVMRYRWLNQAPVMLTDRHLAEMEANFNWPEEEEV